MGKTFGDYFTMRVVLNEITFLIFGFISISLARNEGRGNEITQGNNEIAEKNDDIRNKKLFSLFSIVTFPNSGCASMDASRNGTCYTQSECQDKGGTKSGNCAAGFGVCCLFIVTSTSDTINQNCTYIQNPSFPSVYSSQTALTYTINKCSGDVCAVRLDFETMTIAGPATTLETTGTCTDSFVATGTSGLSTPVICGKNTGQHIYMEMGNSGSTDTATLAFTFSGTSTIRTWEIKATQIPCGSSYRQPEGCLQYHTTLTGRFQTFNFEESTDPVHLANQDYGICIRQEDGYCCIQYTLCSDTNSFSLGAPAATATQDTNCALDWVGIAGVSATCVHGTAAQTHSKLCGAKFSTATANTLDTTSVCDCTAPFIVNIVTDQALDTVAATAALPSRGVCLEYQQIPC